MDKSRIEIQIDLWPVVLFTMHDGMTDSDLVRMFDAYSSCYLRKERFCAITDTRSLHSVPGPSSRSLIARLAKEHEPRSRAWILESNVVMRSELVRGALTAITWLAPPVYPLFYVASLHQAFTSAFAALDGAGIRVPAKVRDYAQRHADSSASDGD